MARVRDLWKSPARRGRGKRWLAVWTGPDGREHTQAFAKKTDADRYGQAQETDAARGTYIDPKAARITVGQWCETWLAGYETRRPSTVRQARVHVAQIEAEFGTMTLGAVRPSHVRSWTSRLRTEDLAASYVYALHGRLAQIMGDAVQDGLIGRSPCSRRTSPGAASQRAYVATTEQVWALHDSMPERLRAAVLLGAFAGLRVAEACGLRVADVDFMRGVIHPRVQYPADELKTETSRTPVPVPRSLALELAAHVKQWPGETVLTGAGSGQLGPWALERAVRAARAKVDGLPAGFRYHDLRHYLGSLLIASGADVKTVQARLRHASAKTTLDTYGHLWPDRDESTRTAIDAVLAARAEQERNRRDAQ
jgi:integrase